MQQGRKLYEGKAKIVYELTGSSDILVEYKDSLTAFNAQKKGSFAGKGRINCQLTSWVFEHLEKNSIKTHLVSQQDDHHLVVRKVDIIPLEVVVRNILAGSTAKKLGIEEGFQLPHTLVEFYYKDDALGDPFVSDEQILVMGWADQATLNVLKQKALQINTALQKLMLDAGFSLVDFKVEFGKDSRGEILLADEISPDCCRLWDIKTKEKFDKDRFRRDLGNVEEAYLEVLNRVAKVLGKK